MNQVGVL